MSSSSRENRGEQATVVPSRRAENILMRRDETSDAAKKNNSQYVEAFALSASDRAIRSRSIELKRNEVREFTLQ
jgi:hypothetical protein